MEDEIDAENPSQAKEENGPPSAGDIIPIEAGAKDNEDESCRAGEAETDPDEL